MEFKYESNKNAKCLFKFHGTLPFHGTPPSRGTPAAPLLLAAPQIFFAAPRFNSTALCFIIIMMKIMNRNKVMLAETQDTVTIPASFMIRMLSTIRHLRRNRGNDSTPAHSPEAGLDASEEPSGSASGEETREVLHQSSTDGPEVVLDPPEPGLADPSPPPSVFPSDLLEPPTPLDMFSGTITSTPSPTPTPSITGESMDSQDDEATTSRTDD
ncbi:unnamed protein product [Cyprideis torosa]|uniref:Uncharacterized protein n=1 Tax=Cyprideis torosa TaxID=163714 RepID=A0A7R8WG45_9CRUS|nr:unnamed protein product [Cyprideis torosa]CAG0892222.1 unnamed protein product [Cyprideis torosa]